jgi:hypothetical protein
MTPGPEYGPKRRKIPCFRYFSPFFFLPKFGVLPPPRFSLRLACAIRRRRTAFFTNDFFMK